MYIKPPAPERSVRRLRETCESDRAQRHRSAADREAAFLPAARARPAGTVRRRAAAGTARPAARRLERQVALTRFLCGFERGAFGVGAAFAGVAVDPDP